MAKQTYTTGQVLTAAQMTTLQTNDYNQTVSAKIASYTLVAADVGTRITMSNASATTITVNTGLFAAGDTLIITNIGVGTSTITAGTATVSTSASLALAQYESGILYFTSTGVAIWQKYLGASTAGGMTLLSTTTLSGAETVISSINQTYTNLFITVQNVTLDATGRIYFVPNATSNLTYVTTNNSASTTAASLAFQGNLGYLAFTPNMLNTGGLNSWSILINNYANATSYKAFSFNGIYRDSGNTFDSAVMGGGATEANDAISAITFTHNQTSFNAGTVKIYGVK